MSYINFKEEKAKAKIQLEKRKKNNDKLYNDIVKKKIILTGYYPNLKYSYKKILDESIGKPGILGEEDFYEIRNEDIICTKFVGCNFSNVKFKECKFIGCIFEDCNMNAGGVVFENCTFSKSDSEKLPSLNREDNLSCWFYNCEIYAKFLNSDLGYSIFENIKFNNCNIELSIMKNVIVIGSELSSVKIIDCDFSGFKMMDTYIVDFYFDDKYMTKFDEKTFFDKIQCLYKDKQEYEGIYMTYQILADKFKDNNLNNNFGEYYYLAKCIERKCINLKSKIGSYISWLTCGYGERPVFCVLSSLGIIFLFAMIYLFVGIDVNGEVIKYNLSNMKFWKFNKFIKDFNESFNLSVGMFGAVGVNNSKPTEICYILSNIEMLIGIVMMGLGIGTLTRKVVR